MATVSNRKFAVVTGASSGIGLALAQQCIDNGFDVMICAERNVDEASKKLSTDGAMVFPIEQDLSKPEGCEALYQAIVDTHRPVEALLLNAGVGLGGPFLENPLEKELQMIALNCNHTVHMAKRVCTEMVKAGKGKVLVTGSVVSTAPSPYQAVYGATKAFVMSFAEALREELKTTGVSVTTLQPGPTDTNFFNRADLNDTKVGQDEKDSPVEVAKIGFQAMMDGKDSVVAASLKSKLTGALHEVLPETIKAKVEAKETKPGSGKRH